MQSCQNKRKMPFQPMLKSTKKAKKSTVEKTLRVDQDTQQMLPPADEEIQQKSIVMTTTNPMQTNRPVDEESELEKTLMAAADAAEERQRKHEEARLLNEKYRLLEDICFPITKSETKYVSIGVIPLRDFEPCVKLHNKLLTSAVCMNIDEFGEFVTLCESWLKEAPEVPTEQPLFKMKNYDVIVMPHKVLQFKSISESDVYKPLFLAVETLEYVLSLKKYILNAINSLEMKRYFYPDYNMFIKQIALTYIENDDTMCTQSPKFNKMLVEVIEDYENNSILYELIVKLPFTIRAHVEKLLKDHYECNDRI